MELRFNSVTLRKVVAALNCAPSIMYLGICLYAPTLALDAVTPLSLWVYIPLLGTIVTLYSAVVGVNSAIQFSIKWREIPWNCEIIKDSKGLLICCSESSVNLWGKLLIYNCL